MSRAQKNNALHEETFYFRKDVTTQDTPPQCTAQCQNSQCLENDCESQVYTSMTVDQIINGKVEIFLTDMLYRIVWLICAY